MATCKAVVHEGPRKGSTCQFPSSDNGYCGRHERNRIYDNGVLEGKKWCRFFFRGCNNIAAETTTSCESCLVNRSKKKNACQHDGCLFKVLDTGFCKKHERDKYYLEQQEKGIKYCDIARGCFNLCVEDYKSCQTCLDKTRILESARYQARKDIIKAIQLTKDNSLCVYCGNDFEAFKTRYNKDSVSCKKCSKNQSKQDAKRKDRIRNFKNEKFKNLECYYKDYINSATRRGFDITLDFDKFSVLVTTACYYCGHLNSEETNGIDRVDNAVGYTNDNSVSCCWTCNRMKYTCNKEFFLEKCAIILKQKTTNPAFFKKWKEYYSKNYRRYYITYKKEAEARGLSFELTEDQWNCFSENSCYLCGYTSSKGVCVDRIDNMIRKYTIDNCRTCCASCNIMKGEMSLSDLTEKCKRILAIHTPIDETRTEKADVEERKHWKAVGLYSAIINNTAESFVDSFSTVYTHVELAELSTEIKEMEKDKAIESLQKLIRALKQRRLRFGVTKDNT